MKEEFIIGGVGSVVTLTGASLSPNEILTTISIILTIIGTLITFIIIPLINWYKNAKKDGKITKEEIKDGVKTLKDGAEKASETISNIKKEDN